MTRILAIWILLLLPALAAEPLEGMDKDVATDPGLWAFRPVTSSTPPGAGKPEQIGSAVDRFILAKLDAAGIPPSPRANRETLLRRVCQDLTGLPPTPDQRREFLQDKNPDAWPRLVDRLLASPAYGERWGRHWLDVARYADTSGDATDMPVPEATLYRDYVIQSFNQDLPYDQFLREQLAGDQLEDDDRWREGIIATGFLALSRRFGNSKYAERHLIIENSIDTVGRAMLGLTLSCARCHDHKFDPVSMQDYYGFYGYFSSTRYPHAGTEHARYRENFVSLLRDPAKQAALAAWEIDQASTADAYKKAGKALDKDRTNEELKQKKAALKLRLDELKKSKPDIPLAWAVIDDAKQVGDTRMQRSGSPQKLMDEVPRAFLSAITKDIPEIPNGQSGRQQLADWITDPDNPLTARVMVNRIWQHHFGRGLVATPNTFGSQGEAPTHPELLDWLAKEFIRQGWSAKAMHRLILNSHTWQQASTRRPDAAERDPENRLWWRMERQRLSGEQLRDGILAVSGALLEGPSPAHPFPADAYKKYSQGSPFRSDYHTNHRSVYQMTRRNGKSAFWELFDAPDRSQSTGVRNNSTVAGQALFLMNSDFVATAASNLAERLGTHEAPATRVEQLWLLAYGRAPSKEEREATVAFATEAGWISLCRTILASNEFIYLD